VGRSVIATKKLNDDFREASQVTADFTIRYLIQGRKPESFTYRGSFLGAKHHAIRRVPAAAGLYILILHGIENPKVVARREPSFVWFTDKRRIIQLTREL
jgi:hypothetical protein